MLHLELPNPASQPLASGIMDEYVRNGLLLPYHACRNSNRHIDDFS